MYKQESRNFPEKGEVLNRGLPFKEVKGPFSVYLRYILNKSESATGAQNAILWPPTPHLSPDSRKGLTSVVFSIRYLTYNQHTVRLRRLSDVLIGTSQCYWISCILCLRGQWMHIPLPTLISRSTT